MHAEAIGRNMNIVALLLGLLKTAFYHIPSDQTLTPAHSHRDGELFEHAAGKHSANAEHQKRHSESNADGAAPHAVKPLHEVNELVLLQRDVVVLQLVFGKLFVLVKLRIPLFIRGRELPPQQLPINHAEATFRQPGDSSERHHAVHHAAYGQQPVAYRPRHLAFRTSIAFVMLGRVSG